MSTEGRVERIFLYPKEQAPAVEVREVTATVDGLEGDHARHWKAKVSLLSIEAWEAATAELGAALEPSTRRANVVIRGVDLRESLGRHLEVGEVRLYLHGETKPCRLMDKARKGLRAVLEPEFRGGVYGAVITGGRIAVGDVVRLEAAEALAGPGGE